MHTQREHADWLVTHKQAAYLLIVKANQPTLHHQLASLPWRAIPIADHTRDRGHGRVETRRLQVTTVAGLDFPHTTQAIRITRRVRCLRSRRWRTVTVYAVTSLTAAQASPARLADLLRGHWAIEALHHLRDTTFAEDASQIRTGSTPPRHGQPAQPGRRHPARRRLSQHRGRAAPQRRRRHSSPAAPGHHRPVQPTLRHIAETLEARAVLGTVRRVGESAAPGRACEGCGVPEVGRPVPVGSDRVSAKGSQTASAVRSTGTSAGPRVVAVRAYLRPERWVETLRADR
jgi:hypothetical protein